MVVMDVCRGKAQFICHETAFQKIHISAKSSQKHYDCAKFLPWGNESLYMFT